MTKRILIVVSTVLLVCLTLLPSFAASIDGQQGYIYVVRTPNTMTGFSLGNNAFPVVDVTLGVQSVSSTGVTLKLFSGSFEDDFGSTSNSITMPITTSSTGTTAPVREYSPSVFSSQWTPSLWDGRYWSLSGSGGKLTVTYYPEDYAQQTSNGKFWYKCWTSSATVNANNVVTSVDLVYQPPQWESTGDKVLLSPDYSINGNDPAYFEALKKTGYYTMTMHCKGESGEKYTVNLEWIAFAGEFSNTLTSYLTQTVSPDVNSGASYDFGYAQGYQDGRNSMQSTVEEAYRNGVNAGAAAADGSGSLISSAILALGEIPFTMLFQITDMEILGMNLGSLVSMAITGAVLIFVIKVFLI